LSLVATGLKPYGKALGLEALNILVVFWTFYLPGMPQFPHKNAKTHVCQDCYLQLFSILKNKGIKQRNQWSLKGNFGTRTKQIEQNSTLNMLFFLKISSSERIIMVYSARISLLSCLMHSDFICKQTFGAWNAAI